jgi:hypothetical protein
VSLSVVRHGERQAAGGANAPKDGDVGICLYCANIMVCDGLTIMTFEQKARAEADPGASESSQRSWS